MGSNKASYDDIKEIVLEIIGDHLGLPSPTLSIEDNIMRDLGADSLDKMELIMTIEELFGIKITDQEIPKIECIGDVANAIQNTSISTSQIELAKHTWRIVYRK